MQGLDPKIYSDIVRDHAARPRHHGPLADPDGHARVTGPCGDTMDFWLTVGNGCVETVSFTTSGCGPSLACGSMAACLAEGRRIEAAETLRPQEILEALGGLPSEFEHCALLASETLRAACANAGDRNKKNCETCGEKDCSATRRKSSETEEEFQDRRKLQSRLCRIRHKMVVLSGKGGVGKSTVAVNLAAALSRSGRSVGLMDIDIHGPSIPTMLGLEEATIRGGEEGLLPLVLGGMKVMSIGFLIRKRDDAVIWRGPMKMNLIRQFLKDVVWGDLDYLIVDSPPGTGDEPLSVCQLIGAVDGAVIVTTPQKVAAVDVRKSITFCRALHVPVLGIVENMSGFVCPKCGEVTQILPAGGGRMIARDMDVPFLGSIPMDPRIAAGADGGRAWSDQDPASPQMRVMTEIMRRIEDPAAGDPSPGRDSGNVRTPAEAGEPRSE